MKWLSTVIAAILIASSQQQVRDAAPKPMTSGTASLSGIVVSADASKTPIRRVQVTLNGGDVTNVLAVTGDDGRFTFRQLPAGRYTLTAARAGFVNAAFGATRPERAGTPIALRDGQQLSNLTISMMRGGVISGIVTDETGAPARDVRVRAIAVARPSASGQRTFRFSLGQGEPVDDRGAFRVFGLPPGDYVIVATPGRSGAPVPETDEAEFQRALQQVRSSAAAVPTAAAASPSTGAGAIFFPGVLAAADARLVRVGPAEDVTGINFAVRPVPFTRVSGVLTMPDGRPAEGVQVRLVALSGVPLVGLILPSPGLTDRTGRFTVAGLPPGPYALMVTWPPTSPTAPTSVEAQLPLWASREFVADGHDVDASLQLRRGARVAGMLTFESQGGQKPPADFSRVRVTMQQVLGEGEYALFGLPATLDASGSFVFNGATPGRYRFQVTTPGGTPANPVWFVTSATLNGRDLIDTPLVVSDADLAGVEVTLTDRPSMLNGALQDASGQPAPEYSLVAFPKDRALWVGRTPRIQQTRPAADGTFAFRGLLPGEYLVSAVTDIQGGEEFDPAFLELLMPSALPVVVKAGEPAVLTMRVK
jgi:uncharacterized protein (DUF2141 family)